MGSSGSINMLIPQPPVYIVKGHLFMISKTVNTQYKETIK